MKMIVIVVAAVMMAGCDRKEVNGPTTIAFAPTLAIGAQFSPQTLSLAGFTTTCASRSVFTTGFDLVIVQTRPVNLFLDRVTLHLIDGSNLGASIFFPRAELNSLFGSTLVGSRRAFGFQPQFGCGPRRPRSIVADVVLTDAEGNSRSVSVNAAFQ